MPNESTRTHTEAQATRQRASLSSILAVTRAGLKTLVPRRAVLEAEAAKAPAAPSWKAAFTGREVAVIAEVKRRSPSAGAIAADLDPVDHASMYARGGARAISVLTDGPHFGGSLDDLKAVRGAVPLPVLRKDFIVDPVQVFESRAAGASAILLIARGLKPKELAGLAKLARDLGLGTLIEVHRQEELETALAAEPDALGVNSRDLETFRVDLKTVETLLAQIPSAVPAVAESGLATRADIDLVASWGADAVLVGTAIASAGDPEAAVRSLAGCRRQPGKRKS
jgi:indole-3-glycerol phosphate synthase